MFPGTMDDTYKTIEKPSEGFFKDKGSRFIAQAFPVKSEDEIKAILHAIKKEHHSARHRCYAWQLGTEIRHNRSNDDGEPSSSAGKPILAQIQSFGLTNILIVVIRYFGGTLLGVSGLINAYRSAAQDAISQALIIEKIIEVHLIIGFEYAMMNEVMTYLKDNKLRQSSAVFDLSCKIETFVRLSEVKKIEEGLKDIKGVKITRSND